MKSASRNLPYGALRARYLRARARRREAKVPRWHFWTKTPSAKGLQRVCEKCHGGTFGGSRYLRLRVGRAVPGEPGAPMVTLLPLPEMIGEFAPVVTAVPGADGASKPSRTLGVVLSVRAIRHNSSRLGSRRLFS